MTKEFLKKIEQPPVTLRDMVQVQMRDAIIEGHFNPGQRLVERPLCEQLGVSRTVVRETIRFLEAEGLVEIIPHKGPVVAQINSKDAREIYEIRMMLETTAAENCAKNMTPALSKTLLSALGDLTQASDGKESSVLLRATDTFYYTIFMGAEREIAWEIVQRLTGRISRLRVMTLSNAQRTVTGIEHMKNICNAIISGDAEGAKKAVQTHLQEVAKIAETVLMETENKE